MSHQQIMQLVKSVVQDTQRPAKTVAIATRAGYCERNMRYLLNELEEAGLVMRVGKRRGWMPMAS